MQQVAVVVNLKYGQANTTLGEVELSQLHIPNKGVALKTEDF
jgi:hypothetical protein